jgi:uncharacterized membrane protein YfcA
MISLLGFAIALTIGLTGVGGGTLTVPVLVLFLGVGAPKAVGSALAFSALVKIPACLVYVRRREVSLRVLGWLLLGGLPGVFAGSLGIAALAGSGAQAVILAVVGVTLAVTSSFNLLSLLRPGPGNVPGRDRLRALPLLAFPIGAEVGFSSAGAGALGTLVLLQCTTLAPAAVVGTDLLFGLTVSALGGGLHLGLGNVDAVLLRDLVIGGIPGALVGARLASALPARALRVVLLGWLVCLGADLAARGLHAVAH